MILSLAFRKMSTSTLKSDGQGRGVSDDTQYFPALFPKTFVLVGADSPL
jgi:hypothetical protein